MYGKIKLDKITQTVKKVKNIKKLLTSFKKGKILAPILKISLS